VILRCSHAVDPLWSVVLAGGRGTRLAGVTGGVPKQFWAPPGGHSLLEATLERLAPLTDPLHTVTVVDDTHHCYVDPLRERVPIGEVIYQPADRGTAAGVLLATSQVSMCDPGAVLVITPSDHGIRNADEFRAGLLAAGAHVRRRREDVVLLGVEPESAAGDYGWIVTIRVPDRDTLGVASFVEKPPAAAAERLFTSGAVWNTMVLVATAEAILGLYRQSVPDVAAAFEGFRFLPAARRDQQVRSLYEHLPVLDFSSDVLTHASGLQCLPWRASLGWTDLGTPERLAAWLGRDSVTPKKRRRPVTRQTSGAAIRH
jgi:mannose-1-phosphate guanylyltransferase